MSRLQLRAVTDYGLDLRDRMEEESSEKEVWSDNNREKKSCPHDLHFFAIQDPGVSELWL